MLRASGLYVLVVCLLSAAAGTAVWLYPIPVESEPPLGDAEEPFTLPTPGVEAPGPTTRNAAALPAGVKIHFADATARAGIQFQHFRGRTEGESIPDPIGSGIAWIDYDQDGLLDLFLVQGSCPESPPAAPVTCKLFKNLGGGKFKDVTRAVGLAHAGCGQGVAVGDIDNDGYPDLFLTCCGKPNVLYHNVPDGKGGRRFQDITAQAGLAGHPDGKTPANCCTSAAFLDYNNDGYLDLFVCGYAATAPAGSPPSPLGPTRCCLYRNNGNGTFTDVSQETGIDQRLAKALGVVTLDLDDDGQTDIFVTNDRSGNVLYRNRGKGRFQLLGPGCGCAVNLAATPQTYRGVDADDLNGDGRPDLFATASFRETKVLWRNEGNGQFLDSTPLTGLGPPTWYQSGFGTCLLDVDRDGSLDIFVTNGQAGRPSDEADDPDGTSAQKAQLFRNDGKGRFRDLSAQAGPYFLERHVGRAVACADYDNDGRMDLALNNGGESAVLLHNESSTPYHWIRLELRGTRSNRDALGARVTVTSGGRTLVRHRKGGGGYLAAHDPRLLIGLGAARRVDKVEIRWPGSSRVQQVGPLDVDRGYRIVEGQAKVEPRP